MKSILALSIIIILPLQLKAQSGFVKRYVDDRINNLTYLDFKENGMFEYRYAYDLIHDFATGKYRVHRDTIFLTFKKDGATQLIESLSSNTTPFRPDTLVVLDKKLYRVKDGISEYYSKPIIINSKTHKGWKPPKSWHYRKRYFLFGPYQSTNSGRYYMIDEQYAFWNTHKKKRS